MSIVSKVKRNLTAVFVYLLQGIIGLTGKKFLNKNIYSKASNNGYFTTSTLVIPPSVLTDLCGFKKFNEILIKNELVNITSPDGSQKFNYEGKRTMGEVFGGRKLVLR